MAVVPVPDAADLLREGGRRRGHDAARRRERQGLEDGERLEHRLPPLARVRAPLGPFAPELLGLVERDLGVDRLGRELVGGVPREDEGDAVAFADGEVGDRAQVLAAGLDRRPEAERVRSGHGDPRVVEPAYPGDDRAVVEADDQLQVHRHTATLADDEPDDVGRLSARGHEVDHANGPGVGLPVRLEDQRVLPVAAAPAPAVPARREPPAAVLDRPEERREAGFGVEVGEAEPVDRAVARDEGGGLEIADHPVVLDPRHGSESLFRKSTNPPDRSFQTDARAQPARPDARRRRVGA